MSDPVIVCPKCKADIPLTSAIEGPIAERLRQQFEAANKIKEEALVQRERALTSQQAKLEKAKLDQERQLAEKLENERNNLAAQARQQAQLDVAVELKDLREQVGDHRKKLEAAQATELALRKDRRELEQQKENLALEVTRRLDEERSKIKDETQKALAAEYQRKEAEKDQQLTALRQQVDEVHQQADALAQRERDIAAGQIELEQARKSLDVQVAEKLKVEQAKIAAEAAREAKAALVAEMTDLQGQLADKDKKLANAQQAELELRQQRRALEEEKSELKLEVARQIDAEREQIKSNALKASDESHRLKEAEKDKQITDLRQTIDELKRKAEQGSQQLQGEVLELELERLLRERFPHDQVTAVPKGVHGGDVIHEILTPAELSCGTILWEFKRTKTWSNAWIDKLKSDQRAAKADLAVIVSTAMPKDCSTFVHMDGVWVTSRDCLMSVATALRMGILQLAETKRAAEGKNGKIEALYNYLSGHEFKHRVEAIVEAFSTMRAELEQEKKAMTKIWAKREKQLEQVLASTTGMHGDLAGIIGGALPAIESIELLTLAAGNDNGNT
ncbi:MAG: DUF2130 domain-containing protein [Phycisphaerales bacterium]|nr:DUF2130 domain-containing protein [Phycisphaerales bacterium]